MLHTHHALMGEKVVVDGSGELRTIPVWKKSQSEVEVESSP